LRDISKRDVDEAEGFHPGAACPAGSRSSTFQREPRRIARPGAVGKKREAGALPIYGSGKGIRAHILYFLPIWITIVT